jgi:MtfA peptidase
MIGRWFRNRRRRQLLANPFPDHWRPYLSERVPHFAVLSPAEQEQLERLVQVFVAEKEWEGCQGLELSDEIRVTIAGQACLLLLGLAHNYFYNVRNILVFPASYVLSHEEVDGSGVVHEGDRSLLGHASYKGPIALSWVSSREGGKNHHDGRNVVLHEFAHKLDFMDGFANGVPRLRKRSGYQRWFDVMSREYSELQAHSERGRATLIDGYGATNPGEFFAVCVECFFEKPLALQDRHEAIYEILSDYFGQDPAARLKAFRG